MGQQLGMSCVEEEHVGDLPEKMLTLRSRRVRHRPSLSLSSGEAKLYSAKRCACRELGLKNLMTGRRSGVGDRQLLQKKACTLPGPCGCNVPERRDNWP